MEVHKLLGCCNIIRNYQEGQVGGCYISRWVHGSWLIEWLPFIFLKSRAENFIFDFYGNLFDIF